jgi:hypothetical protein
MPAVQIGAVVLLACVVALIFRSLRNRLDPAELESQRRDLVNRQGRIGDGVITDIHDDMIFFSYAVHGVDYQATQDITALQELIPTEAHRVIGPVTLKYLSRNPANSIVLCEKWSGLRWSQGSSIASTNAQLS